MVGWMVEQTLKPCLLNLSNGFLVLYFPMAVRSLCMTKDWACFEDICVNHGPCTSRGGGMTLILSDKFSAPV